MRSKVPPNGKTVRTSSIVIEPVSWGGERKLVIFKFQRRVSLVGQKDLGNSVEGGKKREKKKQECYHFCSARQSASGWRRC